MDRKFLYWIKLFCKGSRQHFIILPVVVGRLNKVVICFSRRPGGEKIYSVFDNQLPAALKKLPFEKHLSMQNVRKIVSEADGYQPHLIAPEQGYRRLIESSLVLFRGPAEAVVDAVSPFGYL